MSRSVRRGEAVRAALRILLVAAVGATIASVALPVGYRDVQAVREATASLAERGPRETGSINLVSAIYLGYRAFDTLGETVVLLLAVAGVGLFLGRKQ